MALGGCFVASYGTLPLLAFFDVQYTASDEHAVSFLIGLFGMSIVNKLFEAIQAVETGTIVNAAIERFLPGNKGDSD